MPTAVSRGKKSGISPWQVARVPRPPNPAEPAEPMDGGPTRAGVPHAAERRKKFWGGVFSPAGRKKIGGRCISPAGRKNLAKLRRMKEEKKEKEGRRRRGGRGGREKGKGEGEGGVSRPVTACRWASRAPQVHAAPICRRCPGAEGPTDGEPRVPQTSQGRRSRRSRGTRVPQPLGRGSHGQQQKAVLFSFARAREFDK